MYETLFSNSILQRIAFNNDKRNLQKEKKNKNVFKYNKKVKVLSKLGKVMTYTTINIEK